MHQTEMAEGEQLGNKWQIAQKLLEGSSWARWVHTGHLDHKSCREGPEWVRSTRERGYKAYGGCLSWLPPNLGHSGSHITQQMPQPHGTRSALGRAVPLWVQQKAWHHGRYEWLLSCKTASWGEENLTLCPLKSQNSSRVEGRSGHPNRQATLLLQAYSTAAFSLLLH